MTTVDVDAVITQACDLGRDAGTAAASWVFDGNTHPTWPALVLVAIENGDPILDSLILEPHWLGGLYDYPTSVSLASDLGLDPTFDAHLLDEACTEYETAASDKFWADVQAFAQRMVEDWT